MKGRVHLLFQRGNGGGRPVAGEIATNGVRVGGRGEVRAGGLDR